MYILLVEDDYLQAEWIHDCLRSAFQKLRFERIATEQEFYALVQGISDDYPDVIIIDIMLRWADPSRDMAPPPEEVQEGGFYRAGIRCERKLAGRDDMRNIPVILYTVLERIDLENEIDGLASNVTYLRKDSDSSALTERIRELTHV
jgi:CheY-like chemotaxis protein